MIAYFVKKFKKFFRNNKKHPEKNKGMNYMMFASIVENEHIEDNGRLDDIEKFDSSQKN